MNFIYKKRHKKCENFKLIEKNYVLDLVKIMCKLKVAVVVVYYRHEIN